MGDRLEVAMSEPIVKTLLSWNTVYSADSVEWCPIESYYNILVCGTYQLEKDSEENLQDKAESQKRVGRIYLFTVKDATETLEPIQTIEVSAVLDQKWCQHLINESPYLAVVNAAGFLQIYRLSIYESIKLHLVTEINISIETKVLALSLDWSTSKESSEEPLIVVSDSGGNITLCKFLNGTTIVQIKSWNAHDFEAWICAFDYWDPAVIYTGGDDCCFKVYDIRCGNDPKVVNRCHNAGVTSLHSNSKQEHILASGSYDETFRLWDTRKLKRPIVEQAVGGGIWRIKWDPLENEALLLACMYGGFRLVDSQHFSTANIIAEYNDHSSIAYGADWCKDVLRIKDETESNYFLHRTIATCSFYDCKLNVAQIKY